MNLRKCILTRNDCYRAGRNIVPKGVMVHSTGANNPNIKRYVQPDDGFLGVNQNGNHWNQPGIKKCVHAFIGKTADGSIATYQTLPWDWRGWHSAGDANNTHISFEICEDLLNSSTYFNAVYREAVELTAYLCRRYGLDPLGDGVVICHKEGWRRGIASNHSDVEHWFPRHGKSMDDFRRDVKNEMKGDDELNAESIITLINDHSPVYRTLEDVPSWYHDTIHKLMNRGVLKGTGQAGEINVSEDMCRVLTLLDRMGKLD